MQSMTEGDQPINSRPFRITDDRLRINGRICFDVKVDASLSDAQRQEAEQATNDRFQRVLQQAEIFGKVDKTKYEYLLDSFIDTVVKACCSSSEVAT